MQRKYLVGGPSNSGKSTFVLSLAEHLRRDFSLSVDAIEFDVWSGSYPAFEGKIGFKERPKRFGLDWDWKTPLDERIARFNASNAEIVFGDMPGILDEAIRYMVEHAEADGGLVVSRTADGIVEWEKFFCENGLSVANRWLTFKDEPPVILVGMDRNVDPDHSDVVASATFITRDLLKLGRT